MERREASGNVGTVWATGALELLKWAFEPFDPTAFEPLELKALEQLDPFTGVQGCGDEGWTAGWRDACPRDARSGGNLAYVVAFRLCRYTV